MRVAVFTNEFPGQPCTFFARDLRGLIDAGAEIDVFPFYPLRPALWDAVPSLLDERVLPRTRVHHIPLTAAARLPARTELGRLPRLWRETGRILGAATRYGVEPTGKSLYVALKAWAWARQFPAGSFDHILAYWGNYAASCAYLYHQLTDPAVPWSMFAHARVDLYQKQAFLAEKMSYADNVFLVCEYNRGYVQRLFPDAWPRIEPKLQVHHLGLDFHEFTMDPAERVEGRIITVGRLEELKGVHCLLAAVHLLRQRGIRPELRVVGGGEDQEKLTALATRLGLADQVTFLGWVTPDAVISEMRAATMLVHPSIRPDAMPTVLKEAIALGTPVIASDLAGIPEILDQGRAGVLVPPGDEPALADAIGGLLDDPVRRAGYALRGRAHAERCFDLWANGRRLAERLEATPRRARPNGATR